jgi:hypothetical protein
VVLRELSESGFDQTLPMRLSVCLCLSLSVSVWLRSSSVPFWFLFLIFIDSFLTLQFVSVVARQEGSPICQRRRASGHALAK